MRHKKKRRKKICLVVPLKILNKFRTPGHPVHFDDFHPGPTGFVVPAPREEVAKTVEVDGTTSITLIVSFKCSSC